VARASAYSPSRLQVFQTCARRYYYQYVIKLPKRPQAAQSVGVSLHGALEGVLQAGGLAVTGIAGALALLAARWESAGFATPELEAEARKQAEAQLAAYLERFGEGPGAPVMIEQKLEANYNEVPFLGIVDRVDRLPDGTLELIDYKSGRIAVTPAVKQQLAIYRLLVGEKMGLMPAQVAIHHLASNTRVAVELPAPEWTQLLDRAARDAKAIESEINFDPCVARHCEWCDFNHRCLAYQRSQGAAGTLTRSPDAPIL
jgi:putative RecB family exonuclease